MPLGHIVGRPLGQDCEIGELRQAELAQILVEIGVRRGLDPERVPAERDLVEDRLARLADVADLVVEQQVLGDLCVMVEVPRGVSPLVSPCHAAADEAGIIDAAMVEEGLVLGREEGADQQLGIFVVRELDAGARAHSCARRPSPGGHWWAAAAHRSAACRPRAGRAGTRPQRRRADAREQSEPREHLEPPASAERRKAASGIPSAGLAELSSRGCGGLIRLGQFLPRRGRWHRDAMTEGLPRRGRNA
ncbi:hypothetical protein DdX_20899 [Ditylenchus destructor]|uniref:Uncharacterized protein n=1 Tax=Ditylenchus destructor TaxID=166010 RepID=A0AAD4QW51_9BILA|nr:hypothetical protein DdX_20899 [Ditylenchus destructor]